MENHSETPKPPLPDLTESFHRARHVLALLSGILLTWEFLGLSFGEADSGVLGVKIKIAHPDAIPTAIVALIAYGAFRLGVEWYQCDQRRRDEPASIVDLVVAYTLGIFAVAIYAVQRFTPFMLADARPESIVLGAVLGFALAPTVMVALWWPQSSHKWVEGLRSGSTRLLWTILSGSGIAVLLFTLTGLVLGCGPSVTLGLAIGAALCGVAGGFASGTIARFLRKRLSATPLQDEAAGDGSRMTEASSGTVELPPGMGA